MGKRLTYEFVKEQFEKEGYELLSKEYVDSKTKLKYICPKGHKHSIIWASWQQGRRCFYCFGSVKLTIEFIRSEFAKENYTLLAKKYINCGQKLEYICSKGHRHNITWDSWKQGHRCPYCAGLVKKDINFIRSKFKKEGYKLLIGKYINAFQKLKYVCPKGHVGYISWNNWQRGKRCYLCWVISMSGSNHPRWKNYSEKDLKRLHDYKNNVLQLTNYNYRKYESVINPSKLLRARNKHHLDHIYSVIDGFKNNVPPEIMANPSNLQMLLECDNISKNGRSDISLKKLYINYNCWKKEFK